MISGAARADTIDAIPMDAFAIDSRAPGRDLRAARLLAGASLLAGIAVLALLWLAISNRVEASMVLGAMAMGVLQIVLGLIGFGVGRRGVERAKALALPVALAQATSLRTWSILSLVIGLFGFLGGFVGFALLILVNMGGAMLGGAWGRPLRVGSKTVGATLGRGDRWADGPRPFVSGMDEPTRYALGVMWLHDATKEHGSVPAFAQLTWQLAALGAPAHLLVRCQTSALQEIDHAKRCFAAAETYLDCEIAVGPIDALAPRLPGMGSAARLARRVARQTLEDGCFVEDLNADFAERAHALATDPAMRSLAACIAREEREHADLAWDILRWCLRAQPGVVAHVRRHRDRLPRSIEIPYDITAVETIQQADAGVLAAHGRVPFEEWTPLFQARREATVRRVDALLSEVETCEPVAAAAVASRS